MKPVNRHLLINLPEPEVEETTTTFLLPEDYRNTAVQRYTTVSIVSHAEDCKISHHGRCIVETSMIEDVNVSGETYHIIPENYVVLLLEAE